MSDRGYRVEIDTPGCGHCGLGDRWNVVDPDDVATGTIYEDHDDAEEVARALSDAYFKGRDAAFKEVGRRTGPEDRRDRSKDWHNGQPDERRKAPGLRKTDDDIPF